MAAIYLTLPQRAARLNKPYPDLPEKIIDITTVVRTEIDYGPITKIYGGLTMEADPETLIISCDDDVIFEPTFVETLIKHHQTHPQEVICGTGALLSKGLPLISIISTVPPFHHWKSFLGFNLGPEGRRVDLIFGVAGVLYSRGFFPPNHLLHEKIFQHSLADEAIFHNDDVLISGYLNSQGIKRRVFLDIPANLHANGEDALSGDIFKMIFRLRLAIQRVKAIGLPLSTEPLDVSETPAFRGLVILILLILLVVVVIYLPSHRNRGRIKSG
jgi:hypothetical protein